LKPTLTPPLELENVIWAVQLSPSLIAPLEKEALHAREPPLERVPLQVALVAVAPLHVTCTLLTVTFMLPMFLSVKTTLIPSV